MVSLTIYKFPTLKMSLFTGGEGFNTRQNQDKHMVNKHTDNSVMLSLYAYICNNIYLNHVLLFD